MLGDNKVIFKKYLLTANSFPIFILFCMDLKVLTTNLLKGAYSTFYKYIYIIFF